MPDSSAGSRRVGPDGVEYVRVRVRVRRSRRRRRRRAIALGVLAVVLILGALVAYDSWRTYRDLQDVDAATVRVAAGLSAGRPQGGDPGEADLKVHHVPLREVVSAARDGRIACAASAALVLTIAVEGTAGHRTVSKD